MSLWLNFGKITNNWKDFHKVYTILLKGTGTSSVNKDVSVPLMDIWHFIPPMKIARIL